MKRFLLFIIGLVTLSSVNAQVQVPCADSNIYGLWKKCVAIRSDSYEHPPAVINADSLKKAFWYPGSGTWRFNTDGTQVYKTLQ